MEPTRPVPPRPDRPTPATRVDRWLPILLVLVPPSLALVLPFVGPLLALSTPLVAGAAGDRVWAVRRWVAALFGIGVVVTLGVVLAFALSLSGSGDALGFLLVPLCAPEGSSWLLASIVGVVAYGAVAGLSVRWRSIWLWPVAAATGAATFAATWGLLDAANPIRMVC